MLFTVCVAQTPDMAIPMSLFDKVLHRPLFNAGWSVKEMRHGSLWSCRLGCILSKQGSPFSCYGKEASFVNQNISAIHLA